ncbi:MAG: ABC transporter ATP-binding protein [Salinarimonadaceae bacterium]|nr:MAG: ABC transporter ATP-binding protein [Salinarimonadaceae bacterium]
MLDVGDLSDRAVRTALPPLVALRSLSKRYGDLLANDAIDLEITPGEIRALLGENGAGKSTLVKILYGVIEPSAGDIYWEGHRIRIDSPVDARNLGIGMVFQHFSLFDELTVAENVAVALRHMSFEAVRRGLKAVSEGYGLGLDPDHLVRTLSAGERQRIEIVRCLLQNPKLIVLDEPTSVLTPQESERLFQTLEQLADEGKAILYISHKLEEVRRLCRTATILRGGRVVATLDPREKSAGEIAALMVGAEVGDVRREAREVASARVLEVQSLSMPALSSHERALVEVDVGVAAGEIVGIAGVAGNGQGELFAAISGERLSDSPGSVVIAGVPVGLRGIDERRKLGAAFVPEERLGHAAVPGHGLGDNTVLSHHAMGGLVRTGFIAFDRARDLAKRVIGDFDVRTPGPDAQASKLSGGNLQKFVVGREILRNPKVLVVDQPTWGVDAGAAQVIRKALIDLADGGAGVLIVSQDLDELFAIADRIAVIHEGRIGRIRPTAEWTREAIGLEMMGVAADDAH